MIDLDEIERRAAAGGFESIIALVREVRAARALDDQPVMMELSTDEPPEAWWSARDAYRAIRRENEGKP